MSVSIAAHEEMPPLAELYSRHAPFDLQTSKQFCCWLFGHISGSALCVCEGFPPRGDSEKTAATGW